MKINVVGLGSSDINSISYGAYIIIKNSNNLYLRTDKHPIISDFIKEGIEYISFDYLYDRENSFEDIYQNIVKILVDEVNKYKEITYAVPGNPKVAETSVELLQNDPRIKDKIEINIISSSSFLEDMFVEIGFDPIQNGFILLDALNFDVENLYANVDIVFTQVYSKHIASELKLKLLKYFNDDIDVILFKSLGTTEKEVIQIPLYNLDKSSFEFNHLTSLYIKFNEKNKKHYSLDNLIDIIRKLRGENGCPWDKEQNEISLMKYIKEEVSELEIAINNDDIDNTIEEIGDILMLLAMESAIGEEKEFFDMYEVIDEICKKLIFRHPHVFSDVIVNTVEEANIVWKNQKSLEKVK